MTTVVIVMYALWVAAALAGSVGLLWLMVQRLRTRLRADMAWREFVLSQVILVVSAVFCLMLSVLGLVRAAVHRVPNWLLLITVAVLGVFLVLAVICLPVVRWSQARSDARFTRDIGLPVLRRRWTPRAVGYTIGAGSWLIAYCLLTLALVPVPGLPAVAVPLPLLLGQVFTVPLVISVVVAPMVARRQRRRRDRDQAEFTRLVGDHLAPSQTVPNPRTG